ncbi:hypothetical protein JR316_0003500 [Psilocybe cubensis]|uniref:Uncharacterized protein n=2 Tax=Psilocybe cubensis TaxID=181762 RepID=A0ACB8H819_PSICU|nr:hypothetical protein JR316_0003500 [Psilocybe cubensis]KAH9484021.1 hypothetical protein JR316_0003500 [Psilocybe cubensis]
MSESEDSSFLDGTYLSIAQETQGHYLVGITPQKFLDTFLPWKNSIPEELPDAERVLLLKSVPTIKGNEEEDTMYRPFVEALNGWVTGTDNNQPLVFKHFNKPDKLCGHLNVDVATYWLKDVPSNSTLFSHQQTHEVFKPSCRYDAFEHALDEGPGNDEEKKDSEQADSPRVSGESEMVTDDRFTEAKAEEKLSKLNIGVEKDTKIANQTLGQIAASAGVALSMTFRNHFFSLLILGKYARFIRWDRRGAIVTHRFDYTASPALIFSFYCRYGHMTRGERGFDTHAEPWQGELPKNVCEAFDAYYQRSWHAGSHFNHRPRKKELVSPASKQQFFTLTVKDSKPGSVGNQREEVYFVPAPAYRNAFTSPFSRASKRCLAYFDSVHEKDRQMCFLKDSWQDPSTRSAPEADIYRRLHAKAVENIASMRLGGDVEGLVTVTQDWFHVLSHSGRYKKFGHLVCHRLVLNTVARDLSTFVWCKVLLSCIADAIEAAQQAYKAGVLHRDISATNVMIVRNNETGEWKGILLDWDMCLLWETQDGHHQRAGTWPFIAAELLMYREPGEAPAVQSLWHDMESFFWVLVYQALSCLPHNLSPELLSYRMKRLFFDYLCEEDGKFYGGNDKENALSFCSLKLSRKKIATFTISGLNKFLETVGHLLNSRYEEETQLPDCDLNNPDDKWLTSLLRSTADAMAPMNITRTALASPTNDSRPPADKALWKTANISAAPADLLIVAWHSQGMPFLSKSKELQNRQSYAITSSIMNYIDGLHGSHNNKRAHEDIDESASVTKKTVIELTKKSRRP